MYYSALLTALGLALFFFVWPVIIFWGLERLWPRGSKPERHEYVRALKFWAIFIPAGAVMVGSFNHAFRNVEPMLDLSSIPLLWLVGPLAFLCAYDFFNYWMHRAQHKWFWKQHSVHHSIKHLSALNSYFHPTEHLFRIAFIYVPMALIFGKGAAGWSVAAVMLNAAQSYYVHSPIRWDHGPFKWFLVNNTFHRVHHSIEERHFDKNFGAFTTLWDRLFGTAYVPQKDEWPNTGVPDRPECETVRDYLLLWRGQERGKAAVGTVYPLSEA